MKIIFTWKELIIMSGNTIVKKFPASCDVRNELNGRRKLNDKNQVIKTFPLSGEQLPYMPRQFPSGIHQILAVEWLDDPEFAPVKIKTDATRKVFTWELDENGGYDYPNDNIQIDTCYWLHFCLKWLTTLGCIRIDSENDAIIIARMIEAVLLTGEKVFLEVL